MPKEVDAGTKPNAPTLTEDLSNTGNVRPGQTEAIRSDRSRQTQLNNLLDHFPGYVLAYRLGGFRFVTLRTPAGTTVEQGHQALVHLRTELAKRFPYTDALELQPDLLNESLIYVRGRGWFADYSLEASANGSPHYHVMLAILGYDPATFVYTTSKFWEAALKKNLHDFDRLGPYDIHVGDHLGPETIQYMVGHKRTRCGRNAHDFTRWLGEGEGLGTNWHGAMGSPCRALAKGQGEYLDHVSVEALRARAIIIDEVKWGGRQVPDRFSHFQERETGTRFYVVSGPWLGSAARYLATGSLQELAEYRRALLRCRRQRRGDRLRRRSGRGYANGL